MVSAQLDRLHAGHVLSCLVVWPLFLCLPAHAQEGPTTAAERINTAEDVVVTDAPLDDMRERLMELAFDAVSRFPDLHEKSRCRAQEKVAATALQLDQPMRALRYTNAISNWRRGSCLADIGHYCVTHDAAEEGERYASLAAEIVLSEDMADEQQWRRDRIRSKIARVYLELGREGDAQAVTVGLEESQMGGLIRAQASSFTEADFDAQLERVDAIVASSQLDQVQNGLSLCVELYRRFYGSEELRDRSLEKLKTSWERVPAGLRIEQLMAMAEIAVEHDDAATAKTLYGEIEAVRAKFPMSPEYEISMAGRLAYLRHSFGETEEARKDINAALTRFEQEWERIGRVFRAGTIRPLAESLHRMGATDASLALFRRVVDIGADNKNARPRANDFNDTCLAMARLGVVPDKGLWSRLEAIRDGLQEPW